MYLLVYYLAALVGNQVLADSIVTNRVEMVVIFVGINNHQLSRLYDTMTLPNYQIPGHGLDNTMASASADH